MKTLLQISKPNEKIVNTIIKILGAVLIVLFAVWIGNKITYYGPSYADDFLLWQHSVNLSFFQCISSTRPFTSALIWIIFRICGTNYLIVDVVLKTLFTAIVLQAYYITVQITKNVLMGIGVGVCTAVTQFSDFIHTQAFGIMEAVAHLLAIWVLYKLFCALNSETVLWKQWIIVNVAFGLAMFTHERYMVLIIPFVFVIIAKKNESAKKRLKMLIAPATLLLIEVGLRFLQLGKRFLNAQGQVITETFEISGFFKRVGQSILYLLGINAERHWFCGINWEQMELSSKELAITTALSALILIVTGLVIAISLKKQTNKILINVGYFVIYIGSLIAISSSATRVEQRWMYVPYVAALILIAYCLYEGVSAIDEKMKKSIRCFIGALLLALYCVPYLFLQLYYRQYRSQIYYYEELNSAKIIYNDLIEHQFENDMWKKSEIWVVDEKIRKSLPEDYLIVYDPDISDGTPKLYMLTSVEELPLELDDNTVLIVQAQENTIS